MTAARKLAVVTGGASGIGRATVERLAGDGFALAVLDLDGDEAARSAKAAGDDGLGLAADVSNQGSVERAFARDLVGDTHVAAARIVGLGFHGHILTATPSPWANI